jgi:hypothetical protein
VELGAYLLMGSALMIVSASLVRLALARQLVLASVSHNDRHLLEVGKVAASMICKTAAVLFLGSYIYVLASMEVLDQSSLTEKAVACRRSVTMLCIFE